MPRPGGIAVGEHVNSLNVACQAIINGGGYGFEPDCDAQGNGEIIFRDLVDPELLRRTSTYFGEVVSNLWAARNYVVWHVARLREKTDPPSNWQHLGFPILPGEPGPTETFRGRAWGQLKGLSNDDVAKIEAVQPYQTGNKHPVTGLRQADPTAAHYVLEELAKLDRHRRLAVTALFPVFMRPDVRVTRGIATIANLRPDQSKVGKPLEDGNVVATFLVASSTPCGFEASPGAVVEIFPRDVLPPGQGTFDVWVRGMQKCVADLIDVFAPEFGEDPLNFTPPPVSLWYPT